MIKTGIIIKYKLTRESFVELFKKIKYIEIDLKTDNLKENMNLSFENMDMLILDHKLISEINQINKIKKINPEIKILIFLENINDHYRNKVDNIDGFLDNNITFSELKKIINNKNFSRNFENYISKNIKNKYELTPQEHKILKYLSQGLSNKEIADKLYIEIATVKSTLYRLYKIMKVGNRIQVVIKALNEKLITLS